MSSHAQTTTGTILGTVQDQSGATIATAQVTVTNINTGLKRQVTTNTSGQYIAVSLPVGNYTAEVVKQGFQSTSKTGIELSVDAKVTVDFQLAVGTVQQAITVQASGQLVKLASADIGSVMASKTIEQLPLSTRNFVDLFALSTGVTTGTPGENLQGGLPQSQPFGATAFNINGLRSDSNNFMMDGVDINDPVLSGLIVSPPLDAIQEFKLEQNSYSAEFGRAAGGVINLTMKSGTNQFHGEAFEFLRNKALSARSYFDAVKPPFIQNQFGGIIGGPILRNKLFFFSDYQGTRVIQGVTYTETVPTAAQRRGDLSDQPPIYNPLDVVGESNGLPVRAPFVGNQIPSDQINPVAAKLIAALPLPNLPGYVNNYKLQRSNAHNYDEGDIRIDATLPRSATVFGRYSVDNARIITPAVFGVLGGAPLLAGVSATQGQNLALGYTQVFSPTALNDLRIGFTRKGQVIGNSSGGQDLSNQYGLPGFNLGTFYTTGLAYISGTGLSAIGSSPYSPDHITDNVFQYSDTFTLIRGRHTIKTGGSFIRRQDNHFEANFPAGSIGFSAGFTAQPSVTKVVTGSRLASFMLGYPSSYNRDFPLGLWGLRNTEFGVFVDDLVRVNDRLTLDLGVRYDIFTPLVEVHNRMSNYSLTTKTLLLAGVNTSRATINGDYNDVGPRIGLAYALTGDKRTSLRAGYGLFYIPSKTQGGTAERLTYNPPFAITQATSFDTSAAPVFPLGTPIPPPVIENPNNPTGSVNSYNPHMPDTYAIQWNVDLQRQFGNNWLADTAYVGTRGLNLMNFFNVNQAIPGPGPLTSRFPITPNLASIQDTGDFGRSIYNSLQLRLEKRFSSGSSFLGSYTFARSIDSGMSTGTFGGNPYPQDPRNLAAERGLSSFDIRHRFVASGLYALPFGRGQKLLASSNRIIDALVGEWQLNGILTLQTGLPFSPTIVSNPSNSNGNFNRPNRIDHGGALPKGQRTLSHWFNTSAFTLPALFTYGNSGRDILTGPGTSNLDLSLFKTFPLIKDTSLQFRAESFNLANHPNFANPATAVDAPGGGAITGTYNQGRELQLALKLIF